MESHTKKSTRIIIWIIAITMTLGFIGSYFVIVFQQDPAAQEINTQNTTEQEEPKVDPTAYKVKGDVTKLITTDLRKGEGRAVKASDEITVHYKGTIAQTGAKFDSSYDRGEPVTFKLSDVIEGWQEGIPGMQVGGKRRLVIPSELAYGEQSNASIPANSDLVFEVELLKIK